jgi:hypothetical protein
MKPKDTERLHPAIDAELARLVGYSLTPPWLDAWSRLGPQSTHEERLKVCQAIRDTGMLSVDAGYFLVSWTAEALAEEEDVRRDDPLLTLNTFEVVRASERAFVALLQRQDEGRMAASFRTGRVEHERRFPRRRMT